VVPLKTGGMYWLNYNRIIRSYSGPVSW